ncbi:MAG: sensor histidine kinase [Thermoleophilaceae bacterium]
MTRRLRVRALRPRLMLVVAAGAAVVLALLTVGFNLILDSRLNGDVGDLLRQRASAHLATLYTGGGRLRIPEAPDEGALDAPIWVFAGGRTLERPVAPGPDQRAARAFAGGPRQTREVPHTDTRLYAVPVVAGGRRLGTLVAGASLAPYERSARTALVASSGFALVVWAAIVLAARWAIGAALRPVAEMTAQAERSSETDLDHRFGGEPYDEITRLAATFDRLLARLAAGLRRERSFSAEVSHELRTPLAKLVGEADVALRRERAPDEYRRALDAIRRDAAGMARTLDTLLAAARSEAGGTTAVSDARVAVAAAADACAAEARAHGVSIEVDVPPGAVMVGADAASVERVLMPLIENGCRYAVDTVTVSLTRAGGDARLTVEDDGPGVEDELRARLFEPGVRGARANGSHGGAGLGLALSLRLARALSGDVEYAAGAAGARFRVRLPAL